MTAAIIRLASQYGRYGYRRITAMLRAEGSRTDRDMAAHLDIALAQFAGNDFYALACLPVFCPKQLFGEQLTEAAVNFNTAGEVCLHGEKIDRIAFQARTDLQNHAIGWRQRGYSFLAPGLWYDFDEFGLHLGNVG